MDLTNKFIWDLTPEEVEFAYSKRHMNEYAYAALTLFHNDNAMNRLAVSRYGDLPSYLDKPVKKLLSFIPYMGQEDASIIRINFLYRSYFLFESLHQIQPDDFGQVVDLLADFAGMAVHVEKNDGILLWPYPVVREMTPELINKFNLLLSSSRVEDFLAGVDEDVFRTMQSDPSKMILIYIHHAVSTIISFIENEKLPVEEISGAFDFVENQMIEFEERHAMRDKTNPNAKVKFSTQVRSRGTLYLYGGRHFERAGNLPKAFEWYTKNIYHDDFPDQFVYYLTDFKQCERLLCAFRVMPDGKEKGDFNEFIKKCLLAGYSQTARYATRILDYIAHHPDTDLSQKQFTTESGEVLQYSGESVREVYLISLLYKRIVDPGMYTDLEISSSPHP